MFHPLIDDLSKLKDADIDSKINDLNKKYGMAARSGQGQVCSQIITILNILKEEQQIRYYRKIEELQNNGKNFDDLINVN
jgi:hypothetical protein